MAAVGFEPTPPERLVPKTSALDHSATLPDVYIMIIKFNPVAYQLRSFQAVINYFNIIMKDGKILTICSDERSKDFSSSMNNITTVNIGKINNIYKHISRTLRPVHKWVPLHPLQLRMSCYEIK